MFLVIKMAIKLMATFPTQDKRINNKFNEMAKRVIFTIIVYRMIWQFNFNSHFTIYNITY